MSKKDQYRPAVRLPLTRQEWTALEQVKAQTGISLGRLIADAVRSSYPITEKAA